ncbi:MAG: aldolase/citrate lyase family protein [Bryobacteraceae bacterium]
MTNSKVLSKLRTGELVRVVNISRVTNPWLTEVAGKIGFDAIWLDLEHRDHPAGVVAPMAMACRATGMDLIVRVRKTSYDSPMRVLEGGAQGIMVPHCLTAAEAQQWVDWTKFPPLGKRGFDGAGADADCSLANPLEHLTHANRETFLMLQIEDREAVENVDAIAAVPGVDVLFIGPGDLTISYGIPMQTSHELIINAMTQVAAACKRHGKYWGMATSSPEMAQRAATAGAGLITCGSDHGFLVRGMRDAFGVYSKVTAQE